jgi:formate-dependent nitrite reductase membrane component NrfD
MMRESTTGATSPVGAIHALRPDTVTSGDGVLTSYYGQSIIKAPHWRWLVIVSFFLGGITGASYTVATLAGIVSKDRALERTARYVSFAAFLPCPPLLILDLGRPDRFLNMLRIVKLRSPLSLGSWALSGFGMFCSLSTGMQLLNDVTGRDMFPGLRRVVDVLGVPFSIFLSGYTAVLLAATNIPLWWRSAPFLSPTFISSAFSTGLATISLALRLGGGREEDTEHRLARAEAICLASELTFVTAAVIRAGKIGRPLTRGTLGAIFWPVTYVGGLIVPLALQLSGPARGKAGTGGRRHLAAILALIGGFSLRTLIIFAGRESARRPEDYVAMTQTRR